jgi:H+-transporting ATPase
MNKTILNVRDVEKTDISRILKDLSTSTDGLSASEAGQRLSVYGPNEIVEKKVNPVLKFLGYFWGPIPWMIEIAALLSLIIHHMEDFYIIAVLLMLNAVVAFWQEYKADNAIQALKKRLALQARVLRDKKWMEVSARDLVPGDVVRIRIGDVIPADVKFISGDYVLIDESALTGESMPVEKHSSDIGYEGAVIKQGEMTAVVVSTGVNTYFGRTAKLVEESKTHSHFQKAVIKIGDYLILLAAVLVVIIFFIAIFRHESIVETLQFALVLTVAAIPVALPAVLSVTMAVGAIALAKKEAIVSKLVAIEEMAGMDVLCSDKTGTITKNEITVADIIPFRGFDGNDVLLAGALASKEEEGDPIDNAILKQCRDRKLDRVLGTFRVEKFRPFDPVSKRTEVEVRTGDGKKFKAAKGATQSILALLQKNSPLFEEVAKTVDIFASKGYRALAVARTDETGGWRFVGLIALSDPPREDSEQTIKTAQSMGINVKMVTGDHLAIARQIARKINLGTNIAEASTFLDKSDREAKKIVEKADGFAQVFPEHKYHIVELLQERNHIVGMTGDGVNDAPALKKADAGIAVAGATDAAKGAASIVLTKPGLSVIIDAIKQSRRIFQRMNNYSIYRITETIRVLLFIATSIIVFHFYPVTALMIVLLALLNDAPIMTIAFDNVKYSQQPEVWGMRRVLSIATMLGVIGVLVSFGILFIGKELFHLNQELLQSFIYLKLSVAGHLTVFVARTKGPFWSIRPALPLFMAVIITQVVATLIVVYGFLLPAMGWNLALFVWAYSLTAFVITDLLKVRLYRLIDHAGIKFQR